MLVSAAAADAGGKARGGGAFERAEAKVIRARIDKILADPRFAPRKTFYQWLREKLSGWAGLGFHLSRGWTRALIGVLTIWCVLALLAILGHFIWTLAVTFGGGGRRGAAAVGAVAEPAPDLSYDELIREMRRRAQQGDHRRAIGLMMIALLRWLDDCGALRFHRSKTNRDYLDEYSAGFTGRDAFTDFVRAFDVVIYGGGSCDRDTFQGMQAGFDRVRTDGRKKQ